MTNGSESLIENFRYKARDFSAVDFNFYCAVLSICGAVEKLQGQVKDLEEEVKRLKTPRIVNKF